MFCVAFSKAALSFAEKNVELLQFFLGRIVVVTDLMRFRFFLSLEARFL